MSIPRFSAEVSLYASRNHYSTTGAVIRSEAGVFPTFPWNPLEIPTDNGLCDSIPAYGDAVYYRQLPMADTKPIVIPMSVPAHHSYPDTSSECRDCRRNCIIGYTETVFIGEGLCAGLAAIPFVGEILAGACIAELYKFVFNSLNSCLKDCKTPISTTGETITTGVGDCCPVSCGITCCYYNETCSDATRSLCCSAGTQPCGVNCCEGDEVCIEGICCSPGDKVCLGQAIG